jgi:LPS sulfotransferase NodH
MVRVPYVICATQRSGSSLLCDLLVSTGVAGLASAAAGASPRFHEPLHPSYLDSTNWEATAVDPRRFFAERFARDATANGVAGFKLMASQWEALVRRLRRQPRFDRLTFDDLAAMLPATVRYVHIRRRDRIRQAVSLARAAHSRGEWRRLEGDPTGAPRPRLSVSRIARAEQALNRGERLWTAYFSTRGIAPLIVEYEALAATPQLQVSRVLEFLGVSPALARPPASRYRRLADDFTDLWVARYRRWRRLALMIWSPGVCRAASALSRARRARRHEARQWQGDLDPPPPAPTDAARSDA